MLEWMAELLNKFLGTILSVLPQSPFQKYISAFSRLPYLSALNWVIPVGAIAKIFVGWLAAITLFYIYSIIMRWIKLIGD